MIDWLQSKHYCNSPPRAQKKCPQIDATLSDGQPEIVTFNRLTGNANTSGSDNIENLTAALELSNVNHGAFGKLEISVMTPQMIDWDNDQQPELEIWSPKSEIRISIFGIFMLLSKDTGVVALNLPIFANAKMDEFRN